MRHLRKIAFILGMHFIPCSGLYANPVLDQVTYGNATVDQSSSHTTVVNQTSQQAIINWKSFNIDKGELTHFQQPPGGVVLNRINPTNGASQIYGSLTATGQVILVNPAGIHFGPSAYVNVGGLIATTANITDQDFLKGNYHFTNSPLSKGSIINEGQLIAAKHGLIALIGTNVTNTGEIQAELGHIVLATGKSFTLSFDQNKLIRFSVDEATTTQVVNTGSLQADGGTVIVTPKTAQTVLNNVINMQGFVEASSVAEHNGEIIFSADNAVTVASKENTKTESVSLPLPDINTGSVSIPLPEMNTGSVSIPLPDINTGSVSIPLPDINTGSVSIPLPDINTGSVSIPLPDINTGSVSIPLPDINTGSVTIPLPNINTGSVAIPLPNINTGSVTIPLPNINTGSVTIPLPNINTGSVSIPLPDNSGNINGTTLTPFSTITTGSSINTNTNFLSLTNKLKTLDSLNDRSGKIENSIPPIGLVPFISKSIIHTLKLPSEKGPSLPSITQPIDLPLPLLRNSKNRSSNNLETSSNSPNKNDAKDSAASEIKMPLVPSVENNLNQLVKDTAQNFSSELSDQKINTSCGQ